MAGWRPARPSLSGRARVGVASLFAGFLLLAGCGGANPAAGSSTAGQAGSPVISASPSATASPQAAAVPEPAHTVVVVMENHSYADISGNPAAPFINDLARRGA